MTALTAVGPAALIGDADRGRRENETPSLTGIPHIGIATLVGALAGALIVAAPLAILLIRSGGGPWSIGAALHVAFFGGMGFGGMLGAVLQATRAERNGAAR